MQNPAILVEGLYKQYVVGHARERPDSLYDLLASSLRAPIKRLRSLTGRAEAEHLFWALQDVNFEVQGGDVVGVIGRNGAGKSTLLKVLSRITAPTMGRIQVRGRLANLLEVGTGFHPELSGRENIFLNGAILGMQRKEVERRFDEIVAFAEVERFLDTPVKRYSSGMYVRLAFSVAAHLETDVLLVDEVLAVGDAAFQRKSLGRMSDAATGGKTVLFVSHNLAAIRQLCTRALVLEKGQVVFDGAVEEGCSGYEETLLGPVKRISDAHFTGPLGELLRFESIICRQEGESVDMIDPLTALQVELKGVSLQSFNSLRLKLSIFRDGVLLGSCHDTHSEAAMRKGPFTSLFEVPGDVFRPGRYTVGIGAAASTGAWTWGADVAVLDFSQNAGDRSAEHNEGAISIPYVGKRLQNTEPR